MTHFSQRDNFSTAARVLGALFYYAPDSAEASALVSALSNDGWQAQWPLEKTTLSPLVAQFQAEADESLPQAWQRLFVGPYALPSPPWGSGLSANFRPPPAGRCWPRARCGRPS